MHPAGPSAAQDPVQHAILVSQLRNGNHREEQNPASSQAAREISVRRELHNHLQLLPLGARSQSYQERRGGKGFGLLAGDGPEFLILIIILWVIVRPASRRRLERRWKKRGEASLPSSKRKRRSRIQKMSSGRENCLLCKKP